MKKRHAVGRRPDRLEAAIGKTQIAQPELREMGPRLEAVIGRRN
jgi:hypothetical protein